MTAHNIPIPIKAFPFPIPYFLSPAALGLSTEQLETGFFDYLPYTDSSDL
jgi:hypothetical protein